MKVFFTDCKLRTICVIYHNVHCISFLHKLLELILLSFYAFHNLFVLTKQNLSAEVLACAIFIAKPVVNTKVLAQGFLTT